MRVVVIGGSGLVGAKLVDTLRHRGHDVLAASRRTGVHTLIPDEGAIIGVSRFETWLIRSSCCTNAREASA